MRKTREEKAITLIALIITIVVLLILAVVAINAVTGDGIIQHATNAKTEYEKAQDQEQDVLSYYGQYLDTKGQTGDWIQEKTIIKNIKTEQILEVGDIVDYVATGSGYIDKENDETDNNKKWAVLGVENGHILLVSTINVGKIYVGYINGISDLNNACKDYDNGNGALANSGRSIKVEDINRITGYDPLKTGNGEIYRKNDVRQYLNKVTYTLKADINDIDEDGDKEENRINYSSVVIEGESKDKEDLHQRFINIDGTNLVTEDEYEQSELKDGIAKEITLECTMYLYYPTTLTANETGTIKGIDKGKAYRLLFADEDNNYYQYWLASSFVNTMEEKATFGLRQVYNKRVYALNFFDTINGIEGQPSEGGVRAVVTLKEDVKLNYNKTEQIWKIVNE